MNDEIKEILEFDFESQGERIEINEYERNILKDYITNLQEENERLKLELSGYREAIFRNDKLLGLQDYKSRCEKAIEYIEKNTIDTTFYIDFDGEIKYVLNLLKGDNK